MFQPLASRLSHAALAAADHVEVSALVPPSMPSVIPVAPLVSSETRMFSIDCAVRAQFLQALLKAAAISAPVVSNMLAGKSDRELQNAQALLKSAPLEVFNNGKLVRLEQLAQVAVKFVPLEVFTNGKLVRLVQLFQV